MNETLSDALRRLDFGEPQVFRNLTIVPVLGSTATTFEYVSLGEALRRGVLSVSEVSESGSVPEVAVLNAADIAILLLDGEELLGAKQNRVLNASVLLKPQSKTVVNVSCTEVGRWAYNSAEFEDSGVVMERKIRANKNRSVTSALRHTGMRSAAQEVIWEDIDGLRERAGVHSSTGDMRAVYLDRQAEMEQCAETFRNVEGQIGIAVFVDDALAGLEFVSRPDVYQGLHRKLVQSYIVDSIAEEGPAADGDTKQRLEAFLALSEAAAETRYESPGYGTDIRYEGPGLSGAMLVHGDECIHAALFPNDLPGAKV